MPTRDRSAHRTIAMESLLPRVRRLSHLIRCGRDSKDPPVHNGLGDQLWDVALVTGGTRGIGAAISTELKAAGYTVAANYAGNDEAAAPSPPSTTSPPSSGTSPITKPALPASPRLNRTGRPGRSSGQQRRHQPRRVPAQDGRGKLGPGHQRRSCARAFNMSHAVLNGMRGANFGRIVNISSINGQAGQMGVANYAAAKAGMLGFTKAVALENARKGITVNAMCPGYIAHRPDRRRVRRHDGEDCRRHPRRAASARPTKSPAASSSWSATTPASSPARPCRSTAALI